MKKYVAAVLMLICVVLIAQYPLPKSGRTPESTDRILVNNNSTGEQYNVDLSQVFGASLDPTFDNAVIDSADVDSADIEWANIASLVSALVTGTSGTFSDSVYIDSVVSAWMTVTFATFSDSVYIDSLECPWYSGTFATISDSAYVDTLTSGVATITTGTVTTLTASTNLIAGSTVRGSDSFATTAETDTVTISGALDTDYYFLTPTGSSIDADSDDLLMAEAGTGQLIVHRPANGTSGLTYNWLRVR